MKMDLRLRGGEGGITNPNFIFTFLKLDANFFFELYYFM